MLVAKDSSRHTNQKLLDDLAVHVKAKTGFSLKFVKKPMIISEEFWLKHQLDVNNPDDQTICAADPVIPEIIHSLEGWSDFDFERIWFPSHENAAEWFIEVQGETIKKHTSGLIFGLADNNIWRQFESVSKPDMNLKISRTLRKEFRRLISDTRASNQKDSVEKLEKAFKLFKKLIQQEHWSISVANNVNRFAQMQTLCIADFLSKPNLFAFNNGVYDLVTQTFRPAVPKDYILHTCGYDYPTTKRDPTIAATIDAFYQSIFATEEIKNYRMKTVAAAIYGEQFSETFVVCKGEGRNGKGVEDTLIRNAFGGYYYAPSANNFTGTDKDLDSPNTQRYNLYGKRWISTSEPQGGVKFSADFLKLITGIDMLT
ncbi:hypothetical protein HKX48_003159, partial [Thoreauomyces humboldtii]